MAWIIDVVAHEATNRKGETQTWHNYGSGFQTWESDRRTAVGLIFEDLKKQAVAQGINPSSLRLSWSKSSYGPTTGMEFPEPRLETQVLGMDIGPSSPDPFEVAITELLEIHRSKNGDYARDGKPFDNFESSSELMGLDGFGPVEAALFNTIQKLVRLRSLRQNGRLDDPNNESVIDTYRDLACYSVIAFAQVRQEKP